MSMPVNESNIENNDGINFPNIKIIASGVLLAALFIGGLGYYFAGNKKPSEEPVKEVIEEEKNNQETIENEETEKQEEVIISNEYIPVIDCLWLNILFFVIVVVVAFLIVAFALFLKCDKFELFSTGFKPFGAAKDQGPSAWVRAIIIFIILHQLFSYVIWFILMLIFAAFSKIWDKEHSWWSNVVKGSFRNRIHRGWLSLIPILLPIIAIIVFVLLEKFVF